MTKKKRILTGDPISTPSGSNGASRPKKRILTGDRPTGPLHLGHFVGALKNRVKLQHKYETFIINADVQALTDNFKDPSKVERSVIEVAMDNLAVGIDPNVATMFIQSQIPEIAELTVYFANLVTVSRLKRNPTVKDEIKQRGFEKSLPVGFFIYPVSQAADITVVKGELIPVGEDQVPHVEQTREIVRSFNKIYGQVFPEPKALVDPEHGRLVGLDGSAKMSKSLGNVIYLRDDKKTVREKIMGMFTDPKRIHRSDPGTVKGNPVFIYHDAFNKKSEEVADLKERYKKGKVGDVEVKEKLADAINKFLDPIRERRAGFEKGPSMVKEILMEGTKRTKKEAEKTLTEVREVMKISYS